MQTFDVVMIAVLAGATLFGFLKGMAWQLASLASLVLSYLAALRLSEPLAHFFGEQAPWNRFVAMLVIYLVVSLAIWLAFRVVAGFMDRLKLREFDRQLGGLLGAAKGLLFCLAITFFCVTLSTSSREWVLTSRSGYYISGLLRRADAVMPKELHDVLDPYLDKLEQGLDPHAPPPSPGLEPEARTLTELRPIPIR